MKYVIYQLISGTDLVFALRRREIKMTRMTRTGRNRPLTERERLAKRLRWESCRLAELGLAPALPLLRQSCEEGSAASLIVAALVRSRQLAPAERERVASFLDEEEERWSEARVSHRLAAVKLLRESLKG